MVDRLRAFFFPIETREARRGQMKAPWRVFWVGFAVRLAYMTLAHTYRIKGLENHFKFGFEAGRIAWALASGYGYADPFANAFVRHTGPTAWLPPAYPLLLAGVFKLFGVYTNLSAWVVLAIQCGLSASTGMAVWELGGWFAGRVGLVGAVLPSHRGEAARDGAPGPFGLGPGREGKKPEAWKVAAWAGWIWALYPAAMQYAVGWVWEMTLTTWLFAWVLVLAFRMRAEPERRVLARWLWFGLAWGAIALSNSTLLLFLPVCGIWILRGSRRESLHRGVAGAALATVVFLGCIAPWTVRNWQVFHTFIPLRGNLGAEMYMGNGPGANGFLMEYDHPFQSAGQLHLYATMGEVKYVKVRGMAADAFIRSDPGRFVRDTLLRGYFFWVSVPHPVEEGAGLEFFRVLNFAFVSLCGLLGLGLALWRKVPGAGLWAWAFLLLPIPYYVVTVHARFRHPLEPLICVLGVYLFQSSGKLE